MSTDLSQVAPYLIEQALRELPRRMSRVRGAKIHDGVPVHTPPTPSSFIINNLYLYITNTYHVHHTNSLR